MMCRAGGPGSDLRIELTLYNLVSRVSDFL